MGHNFSARTLGASLENKILHAGTYLEVLVNSWSYNQMVANMTMIHGSCLLQIRKSSLEGISLTSHNSDQVKRIISAGTCLGECSTSNTVLLRTLSYTAAFIN